MPYPVRPAWRSLSPQVWRSAPPAPEARAETLAQTLTRAYQNNPQLRAARAALRAVDEQASQAFANWRPSLSVSADAGYTASRSEPSPNPDSSRIPAGAAFSITQNLYRGGRNLHQWRQANANISAQRARLANVEQNVLLNVVPRLHERVPRSRGPAAERE